ncbi:N-acetyltransferase family protein ASCRUDRAFT_74997 [Ascoidea rubescens DSM 1968]|uniref:N-acetyltransferase domain-containing protein n=1 Tax=Ascoidea rubescens DSM 1968 TaxID=1344418 RepID=A0A1D2VM62_9ASCO|nr:hypothetical protein ASCRUDRAFT_74997 [Ascoidea rubescens DSM 1968]ODV62664.1 hypothetical protein ASCRUDRAFT_74997 [Ascoidea rubescens DSM 1968]
MGTNLVSKTSGQSVVPYSKNHEAELKKLKSENIKLISEPVEITLEDGKTRATCYPIDHKAEVSLSLFEFLSDLFAEEIEKGNTYPYFFPLSKEEFENYWFGSFCNVMLLGTYDETKLLIKDTNIKDKLFWKDILLGSHYIRPNYAGHCSHICNAGFLVNPSFRGSSYKVGKNLGVVYLKWAPLLGYTYSVFNLVFENNPASFKIWDSLGFDRIGYIKGAGRLNGSEDSVGAIMFGKDLTV